MCDKTYCGIELHADNGIRYAAKDGQPWLTPEQAHDIASRNRQHPTPELRQHEITREIDRWPAAVIIRPPVDADGNFAPWHDDERGM